LFRAGRRNLTQISRRFLAQKSLGRRVAENASFSGAVSASENVGHVDAQRLCVASVLAFAPAAR